MSFDARDLDYALPEERIAQEPLPERDAARLLCLRRGGGALVHRVVRELPELLPPSLLVLNDTRVIPARLHGHKPSGGKVELLLVERRSAPAACERWLALAKGKALRPGAELVIAPTGDGGEGGRAELHARLLSRDEHGWEVELALAGAAGGAGRACALPVGQISDALRLLGEVPLPPYIKRSPDALDESRYQTVYAAHEGAVAAPTAGLHLTAALLERLRARGHELAYVTLHVGPGTFAPLRSDRLSDHLMHEERYAIPAATVERVAQAKRSGRPVLAVGTTVVRTLEAAADADASLRAGPGRTSLFLYPPYRFRVVDALLTNFHLPRSTLLALVMAFGGIDAVRGAYAEAIAREYRFFSYGDAMLIGAFV